MSARVTAVSRCSYHDLRKQNEESITLLEGRGVEGDAHCSATVQHRSLARRAPEKPNLRQVHLLQGELHDELRALGFDVAPGEMGENITTHGIDLLALPLGTRLHLGDEAVVLVTGLRDPCRLLDKLGKGLMEAVLVRDASGKPVERRAGIMSVVETAGVVRPGDPVRVELPPQPYEPLAIL